jgi:ATP phosphoribosyltransferase
MKSVNEAMDLKKLRLGLPKGSLQDATFELLRKAGYIFRADSRSYQPSSDDPEIEGLLLRPQEIPRYVEQGILDAGFTGYDWVVDNGSDVVEVADLVYGKQEFHTIKVVLAAPKDGAIRSPADLQGKRIATEYVNLTKRWLERQGVTAQVEFSWGACEAKVPELADAIVANTETGSSLRANGLSIVEVLLESSTRLIANHAAWEDSWKRAKMEDVALLIQGALNAHSLVGLKMNVPRASMDVVLKTLPALQNPTVSPLADESWLAVEVILPEKSVRDLIPDLKRAGATGIVEYPLNKVIY